MYYASIAKATALEEKEGLFRRKKGRRIMVPLNLGAEAKRMSQAVVCLFTVFSGTRTKKSE